jgi:subfamily B ATP-binding cassette protein HlyB/CyaB
VNNGPLFATGTFIWGLAAICQLHRRPFAPNLVLQQFPSPYTAGSLQAAAAALNLRSGLRSVPLGDLDKLASPFLTVLSPAAQGATASEQPVPAARAAPHGPNGARGGAEVRRRKRALPHGRRRGAKHAAAVQI